MLARLVRVYDANPAHDSNMSAFSPQDLDDFSRQQDVFSNLGGYWYSPGSGGLSLTGAGEPAYLETVFAGNGFFSTLGVALVIAEIALACTLLAVSGLVLRSLWKLLSTDPGFDSSHVLAVQLSLPEYKYHPTPKMEAYRDELLRRVAAAPGVEAVGGSKTMPLFGGGEPYQFSIQEAGREMVDVTPTSGTYIVTTGYFQALKIPVVSGRTFDQKDFADHAPLVVINQQLARKYRPGKDPVGKFLHLGKSPKDKLEVIGVVGDVRNEGLNQENGTAVYFPESRASRQKLNIFVRTNGDPLSTAAAIRRVIHDFEPDQAVNDMATLEQVMHETVSQPRFISAVLTAFGGRNRLVARLLGSLRSDFVQRPPADARDRSSHGARGGPA